MAIEASNIILSVPHFRQRFERLQKRIEENPQKVIPWIGAGMSKPFGLPLWKEFLEGASSKLMPEEKEIFDLMVSLHNPNLSLIAEFLHSRLGGFLHQEIINTFNKSIRWEPSQCIIPWLGVHKVITTNYDRVLDSGLPWLAPVTAVTAAREYRELRCLIKLHGRVDDPKTVVLTTSQYIRAYTTEFWTWLEQFARDHTFIFLGCSLNDDEFLSVLKTSGSDAPPQHFAIIPTRSPEESVQRSDQLLRSYGIETISYDPIQHGHSVVRELLTKLRPKLAVEKNQIERITNEAELELAWFIFHNDKEPSERNERISYLTALLPVAQSLCPNSTIRSEIFDELLKYCDDRDAVSTLLEVADGSSNEITRILHKRDDLRPVYEIVEALPPSQNPLVKQYYGAFRFGNHDVARSSLLAIEKRPMADQARIAVLILQNELYAGQNDQQLILDFESRISKSARRSQYLHYGIGLFYLWTGELERAKSNFRIAQSTWQKGRSAFVFWQLALCAILERDFNTARVQLAEMENAASPPLGIAADFIAEAGGSELSLEPRRMTSQELYAWIWFIQDLIAKASGQSGEANDSNDSKLHLVERNSEPDLLLSWFLYAERLLEGRNDEPLRIELQHRTQKSLGTKLILNAVGFLIEKISKNAALSFFNAVSSIT